MTSAIERAATLLVALAAITIAGVAVRREYFREDGRIGSTRPTSPILLENWRRVLRLDRNSDSSAVSVVVVSDLECPFCRKFHLSLRDVLRRTKVPVTFEFVHFPLPQHRFALPAARAAECARDVGKFDSFVDLVFELQDSLGLKSWGAYARDAGISDTLRIVRCANETSVPARIAEGIGVAKEVNIVGTPTVFVDGWRYPVPPYDSLEQVISAVFRRRLATPH